MSIFTAMLARDAYRTDRVILKGGASVIVEVNGRDMDDMSGWYLVDGVEIEVECVDAETVRQK